jgi:hypothetical protein
MKNGDLNAKRRIITDLNHGPLLLREGDARIQSLPPLI